MPEKYASCVHAETVREGQGFSTRTFSFLPILVLAVFAGPALAQTEEFGFDLADYPERHLRVQLLSGGIEVLGVDGDQVLVSVSQDESALLESEVREDGMRRLPNGGQNLVVRQDGGQVIVRAGTTDEPARVTVRLPRDARLSIHSVQDGDITVENVYGEMELQSSSGTIDVIGLRNTAAIHAQADDVTASVATSDLPGPVVLSSWSGDVELVLPGDLSANLRWRTSYGEVLSDLSVENITTVTQREEDDDGIRLEGFTQGTLNGGGSEISVTAYSGDIVFRRGQ